MLWRPHHLIRAHTKFDFLGKRKLALILSTTVNVAALVGAFVFGLNFGIDFEGGIAVQVRAKQGTVHLDELRSTLGSLGVGEVSLQEFGDADQGGDEICLQFLIGQEANSRLPPGGHHMRGPEGRFHAQKVRKLIGAKNGIMTPPRKLNLGAVDARR